MVCPHCGATHDDAARPCLSLVPDARIGTTIGGVELVERVSRGPLGAVYRGRRGADLLAVKIYRSDLAPTEAARVDRERAATMRIRHPGVASLAGGGLTPDGEPYLVREWVIGRSLEERFVATAGSTWPTWKQMWLLLGSLSQGLSAIHAAGVIHRDIKPANIIVPDVPDGARAGAVLVDLGHSLILDGERLTEKGLTVGSAAYMSPEQAAGLPLDGTADLYSLGVVLYRGLTGRLPFCAPSTAELLVAHQTMPVVAPSRVTPERRIPPVADDLCLWLLAKSAAARVPSARVLTVVLSAIANDENEESVA